jgi:DNA mismatch repair protein MutL
VTETVTVPWFRIAGVAFNCYVFVEMEDKMLVIDKHAAHERVLFERMRDNMKSLQPVSQLLMLPIELRLAPEEFAAACEYREEFFKVGFDFIDGEEENTAALLQYPSGLTGAQAEAMFAELVYRLASGTGDLLTSREQIYEKALYQASCKAAVKAGREDTPENIRWIAEQVIVNPRVRYCPHGRPVAFEMTKGQFERQFERT